MLGCILSQYHIHKIEGVLDSFASKMVIKELIPKPTLSYINKNLKNIFLISRSIENFKFEIQRVNSEFWDQLISLVNP
jgi:hypothetical protein